MRFLQGRMRRLQRPFDLARRGREIDALYAVLYRRAHDLDDSGTAGLQTQDAFATQWKTLPEGQYLLSDPWFRANVVRILSEEELLLRPEWFRGKDVLDAGCGNGRWSFGFASLGANVTAVDVNQIAVDETRRALEPFCVRKEFHVTPLETVAELLQGRSFDLVFSWGVLHHCGSFTKALDQVASLVRANGVLYLYLYGRESIPWEDDLALFKERVYFNSLPTAGARLRWLTKKAHGNKSRLHVLHDVYAPLVNRRFTFDEVEAALRARGFSEITRTVDHTEIFVRAVREPTEKLQVNYLQKKQPPWWFQHHE